MPIVSTKTDPTVMQCHPTLDLEVAKRVLQSQIKHFYTGEVGHHVQFIWTALRYWGHQDAMTSTPTWHDYVVIFRLVTLLPRVDLTLLIFLAVLHTHELDWLSVGEFMYHCRTLSKRYNAPYNLQYYTSESLQNRLVCLAWDHSRVLLGINDPLEFEQYRRHFKALCYQKSSAGRTQHFVPRLAPSALAPASAVPCNRDSTCPPSAPLELAQQLDQRLSFRESTSHAQTAPATDTATLQSRASGIPDRPAPSFGTDHTAPPSTLAAPPAELQPALRRSSRVRSAASAAHRQSDVPAVQPQRSSRNKRNLDSGTDASVGRKKRAKAMAAGR